MTRETPPNENAIHDEQKLKLQTEAKECPERVARLTQKVEVLFPDEALQPLREQILESFQVPQWGKHHNEGIYMDTHLDLILTNLENIQRGEFPPEIPDNIKKLLQEATTNNRETLERYTFLHDISKKDCLTIKFEDGTALSPTWQEWQDMLPTKLRNNPDPETFAHYAAQQHITAIGYYQPEIIKKNEAGKTEVVKHGKMHGREGAEVLRALGYVGVSPAVLKAIEKHEVAYSFVNASAKTYEQHFDSLSDQERTLALVASYSDTTSALTSSGKPDLSNFMNMLGAKHNYELWQALKNNEEITAQQQSGQLDAEKVKKELDAILQNTVQIPLSIDKLLIKIKKECTPTRYNTIVFAEKLIALVAAGTITEEQKKQMVQLVADGQAKTIGSEFGKALGKNMRPITQVLKESECK
ncbi:MAG: hypothetical protein HY981_01920 [Candidatus Magasanikbacteria bacterium]|nr:hypothetical protein [Candidatus Magasanikbacteria bacterium]